MTHRIAPLLTRARATLIGALALIVALTSAQMVVARAQAAAVDRIVICSGYGVITVDLDADGNPVGPVHLCPECMAAHGLAILGTPDAVARPVTAAQRVSRPPLTLAHPKTGPQTLRARGPPGISVV